MNYLSLLFVCWASVVNAAPAADTNAADGQGTGESQTTGLSFTVTHIITAAAVFTINGVNFLTDPFFSPANTTFDPIGPSIITVLDDPALQPEQIPPIDAVLLSHEDHPDNLDPIGRTRFLDGRKVLTTPDGMKNLQPRPGVRAMENWKTLAVDLNGQTWNITGTPCQHLPGGQVTGFVLVGPGFGTTNGLPNAIWYSGDTIYLPELARLKEMFYIKAAVMNMGAAFAFIDNTTPDQITMTGSDVAQLFKDIGAEVLVPMHFGPWTHFPESVENVHRDFEQAGIKDKVRWLTPGEPTKVL
ncbi:Zn-dependent hydrolases of the beta-lactamase protein [Penicillium mononematosum]|uniref:Zn-dependent hydrolases of the beta-lactamase protein n=1 Tax=Penicillium mononematosum TaxID=268346 RepID=UPI002548D9DA|nr:Zn-dependent hydrolases of the beta-lactamase protein [Penicillium mononematosum]KAJ6181250.1 Zn-dependent hydrolases of the beta-lactamase protein [Penicillium mononematosum]